VDIFSEAHNREQYDKCYDESLKLFGIPANSLNIETTYGQTHVLQFGDPKLPPLVLIHGYAMSSAIWYPNVPAFSKQYAVYAIDIIGDIGKSIANQVIMHPEQVVEWLHEVLDHLQLDKVYLAGHSIGGYISLRYALTHQTRIIKLVLYAPAASFHRLSLKFFYYAFPGFLFHTEKWIDRAFGSLSSHNKPLNEVFRQQIIAGFQHSMPLFRLYPVKIDEEQFASLKLPILIMIGESELLYPAKKAMDYARKVVPHAQFLLVAGANHSFIFEQAKVVNHATLTFLGYS